jgi:hypothetical protein
MFESRTKDLRLPSQKLIETPDNNFWGKIYLFIKQAYLIKEDTIYKICYKFFFGGEGYK